PHPHLGPDGPVCGLDPAANWPAQPPQPAGGHRRRARDYPSMDTERDNRRQAPDRLRHPGPGGERPIVAAKPVVPPRTPDRVRHAWAPAVMRVIPVRSEVPAPPGPVRPAATAKAVLAKTARLAHCGPESPAGTCANQAQPAPAA